jgi:hypothetical protein
LTFQGKSHFGSLSDLLRVVTQGVKSITGHC